MQEGGLEIFFIAIVLQEKGNCIAIWGRLAMNCIAILVLYCNLGGLKGWKIVLQYREVYCNGVAARLGHCIARCCIVLQYRECNGLELYCKTTKCIATRGCLKCIAIGRKLYCKRRLEGLRIVLQYNFCIVTNSNRVQYREQ